MTGRDARASFAVFPLARSLRAAALFRGTRGASILAPVARILLSEGRKHHPLAVISRRDSCVTRRAGLPPHRPFALCRGQLFKVAPPLTVLPDIFPRKGREMAGCGDFRQASTAPVGESRANAASRFTGKRRRMEQGWRHPIRQGVSRALKGQEPHARHQMDS